MVSHTTIPCVLVNILARYLLEIFSLLDFLCYYRCNRERGIYIWRKWSSCNSILKRHTNPKNTFFRFEYYFLQKIIKFRILNMEMKRHRKIIRSRIPQQARDYAGRPLLSLQSTQIFTKCVINNARRTESV